MLELKLDLLQTLTLAAVVYFAGVQLRQRIAVLDRLNIPSAVVGGLPLRCWCSSCATAGPT